MHQRGCIGEIHDPRAAGPEPDEEVDRPLEGAAHDLAPRPRRRVEAHARIAVAVDEAVDVLEHVGPHGLGTGIAAPGAADRAGHEEEADARHDQQARDEVEFMRPDLDAEHVEAAVGEIDQHRLVGRVGATVPADPRRAVVDREGDDHDQPLEAAERPVDALVVNRLARFVELLGQVLAGRLVRLVPPRSGFRAGNGTRDGIVGLDDPVFDYLPRIVILRHRLRRPVLRPEPPRSPRLPRANGRMPSAS